MDLNLKTISASEFSDQVRLKVKKGSTYMDSIIELQTEMSLNEKDTAKLLEPDVLKGLTQEMVELNRINE